MTKSTYYLVASLLVALVLLAACAPAVDAPPPAVEAPADAGADTAADAGDAGEESEADAGPVAAQGEILQRVLDRGLLICGGRTDFPGFGSIDEGGTNIGFDVDFCRAIAAAVLGDPNAIEIVPVTAADRGPALQTAEVDVMPRVVTWNSKRDAEWGNFTLVTFYDGQGFMVRGDSGITSLEDMDGAAICVTSGTTTESNLASVFADRGLAYEAVIAEESAVVYSNYDEGRCDAVTSDKSQLAGFRTGMTVPDDHVILEFTISKEPLTPVVPHGDDTWFDIVKIVIFALINAEELDITQDNVEEMMSSENSDIRTILGVGDDWGYGQLGMDADALARAISAVGNYGEIYDRYMGPEGSAFTLPRGPNELWTNGGLIYAPSVK